MRKKLLFVTVLALVMVMAVTPVLASGSGSQNEHQNQEVKQNQSQPQNQEQNNGETQNQEKNLEQGKHQEQAHKQHHSGSNGSDAPRSSLPGTQLFTLTGTIKALQTDASITVTLHNGNRFIKRLVEDGQLLIEVTGATEYRLYTGGTCIPGEFSDLTVGDTVHIKGTMSVSDDGAYTLTATRVTVDVPCCTTSA